MSEERRSEPDARILRQMVRELADEPVPELPWEKIEARLFSELDDGASSRQEPPVTIHAPAPDGVSLAPELEDRPSAIPATPAARIRAAEDDARHSFVPPVQSAAPSRWGRAVVFAAAIAAGLGGLFIASSGREHTAVAVAEPIDPTSVPQAPGMEPGVLDARSLGVGDVVEAALGPLAFGATETAGASSDALAWTLAAGSRAVVREPASSSAHVVELESGSVRVEASGPRRLVVRAGETEVASVTSGAVFSVTRSSRGLVVHVEVGTVVVGERGAVASGVAERTLGAPTRASISLDGARQIEVIPPEVASLTQPPAPRAPEVDAPSPVDLVDTSADSPRPSSLGPAPERSPVGTPPAVDAPAPLSSAAAGAGTAASQKPMGEASIRASLQRCFADVQAKKSTNEGVSVSVSSTLRVTVRADGSVQGLAFNPPLQSDLQSCAVFLFRENLGPGARTVSVAVAHAGSKTP